MGKEYTKEEMIEVLQKKSEELGRPPKGLELKQEKK
ncbi:MULTISPECIES: homing endonuclease associated repeat-containing protein [Bacillus]|uniref:Uncharacterized protein n=1 Tax=Bacillus glycinifermentans TaxID=1664069 RepID=A0ABU6HAW8_9BACI|nr:MULTISPECIES: hypothetical protein [Bacillus]MEC0341970.1 hypothetical protein [Bacillus sonorensis]MEC0457516.1 hypothetical protein [Bacillus sonorensis]MEC0487192.1 hypothetical protein [Bacillus glycinifermentans]MEC0530689.1 hypothetical protein [Bacillus sonorensis]UBF35301.1 hypothetical protein K9N56_24260 [Bacillus sp. PM8313]